MMFECIFFRKPKNWIRPVEAPDNWTRKIGQKRGKLFVSPIRGIPDIPETAGNGYVLMTVDGDWIWSGLLALWEQNTNLARNEVVISKRNCNNYIDNINDILGGDYNV